MTKRPYKLLPRTEIRDLPFQIVNSPHDLILKDIKKSGMTYPVLIAKHTKVSEQLIRYWLPKLTQNGMVQDLGVKTILENGIRKKAHLYGVKK